MLLYAGSVATADEASDPIVIRAEITGTIDPGAEHILERAVSLAQEHNAQAILLILDTPGGRMDSMDAMVRLILGSNIPVITYVAPPGASAGSAGVYIMYASHVAAMAPATNIGSATPVSMFSPGEPGSDRIPETAGANDALNMKRKFMNHVKAQIRGFARHHGRNAEFGERTITHAENVTSWEALELRAIDLVADSEAQLLEQADGRRVRMASNYMELDLKGAEIRDVETDFREDFFDWMSHPMIAYFLMMAGLFGIMMEIQYPGNIWPGVLGAIALILGLFAMRTLPVSYAGILLLILAAAFFILEVNVVSYGFLTIAGIAALVLGSLLLVRDGDQFLGVSLSVALGVSGAVGIAFGSVAYLAARSQRTPPSSSIHRMKKERGQVQERVDAESGTVFVHGEIWQARTNGPPIESGAAVRVTEIDGLTLTVEPFVDPAPGPDF